MGKNIRNNENLTLKVGFYILSMWPMYIVVALLCAHIPMCFEEGSTFIGFSELYTQNVFPIYFLLATSLISVLIGGTIKYKCNHDAKHLSETILEIENKNYDTMAFVASYFFPLVSFTFSELNGWLVLGFLYFLVGIIFVNTDMFYNNPTLLVFGYKIYKVKTKTQSGSTDEYVVITNSELAVEESIKNVALSEGVNYCEKWEKNK